MQTVNPDPLFDHFLEKVFYLSLAVASLAFTLTETRLFAFWREWVRARSVFMGKLVCCGYCTGHWLAFFATGFYQPRLFFCWKPLDYFLTSIVIAWLAGFQWAMMCLMIKKTGK